MEPKQTVDQKVQSAIDMVRRGDKKQAQEILETVIEEDQYHETA